MNAGIETVLASERLLECIFPAFWARQDPRGGGLGHPMARSACPAYRSWLFTFSYWRSRKETKITVLGTFGALLECLANRLPEQFPAANFQYLSKADALGCSA